MAKTTVDFEMNAGGKTRIVAPCPHCGKPLVIEGEHPLARITIGHEPEKPEKP